MRHRVDLASDSVPAMLLRPYAFPEVRVSRMAAALDTDAALYETDAASHAGNWRMDGRVRYCRNMARAFRAQARDLRATLRGAL